MTTTVLRRWPTAVLIAAVSLLAPATASAATGVLEFKPTACAYVPIWMNHETQEWQARATGVPPNTEIEFVGTQTFNSGWRNVVVSDAAGTATDERRPFAGAWQSYPVTVTAFYAADPDGVRDDPVGSPVTIASAPSGTCDYVFSGFAKPLAAAGKTTSAKAGRVVPLRWRVTFPDGTPISSPGHVVGVLSSLPGIDGESFVWDIIWNGGVETLKDPDALTYLGDGRWQYDWQTERSWAGTKRQLVLWLADGPNTMARTALFKFSK